MTAQQKAQGSEEIVCCERCGRTTLENRHKRKAWDEEPCRPGNCSVWKLVGKSKGGSPILMLVED